MFAAILLRYSIQTILYSTRRQSNLLKQPVKVGGKKKKKKRLCAVFHVTLQHFELYSLHAFSPSSYFDKFSAVVLFFFLFLYF